VTGLSMSQGQEQALAQIREIIDASDAVQLLAEPSGAAADGWLTVRISLDCAGTPHAPSGLKLRSRERFAVLIPRNFPFDMPTVQVPHLRWAGTPHVQWGFQLCLYAAPSVEWVPADGMFGLIERLTLWLERASLGELDPDDQPLHPPVAYVSRASGVVVVHADIGAEAPPAQDPGRRRAPTSPTGAGEPAVGAYRLLVGVTEVTRAGRLDLVEWVSPGEWLHRFVEHQLPAHRDGRLVIGVLAVLTDREMSFEYPKQAAALIDALESAGVPRTDLFHAVGVAGAVNYELARQRATDGTSEPPDFHLFVGTPSRRSTDGILRQHLVCWRFDNMGRLLAENLIWAGAEDASLAQLGELAQDLLPNWIAQAEISWVRVMESRPEVTTRRDVNSSAAAIRRRRILILGCGALGAPIAEYCVRAGAASVRVLDNDVVTPGILVRQPYADGEIGLPKAEALAARLNMIRRDKSVSAAVGSAESIVLAEGTPPSEYDLVVDATADSAVSSLIELRRRQAPGQWPTVISLMIGHDARRGIVAVAKHNATGAGRHIFRRLALASRGQYADRLADIGHDFFPLQQRAAPFQPEPGCSSPTFVGSAADLAALSGHLFDVALRALAAEEPSELAEPMIAAAVRLDGTSGGKIRPAVTTLAWPNDVVARDCDSGYEVRISQQALAGMRTEVRRGARVRGPKIETGGLLLGQVDHACRCIWIDDVSGPPPDSLLSEVHFDHGIEGVEDLVEHHRHRTGRLSTFVGIWHSHPFGEAEPSRTDKAAMTALITPVSGGPSRALVLILGGTQERWTAWVDIAEPPDVYARFATRATHPDRVQPPPVPARHRSEAWPGGWQERPKAARAGRRRWFRKRRKNRLGP
jgi:integrative and conjugative element protein (TIGR02256 family)